MMDAGFEAVLAVVLLLGVLFGTVDENDYAAPASDIVLAVFAFGLFVLAYVLAELVKREAITDGVLKGLAAANTAFAALIAVWVLVADGFSPVGQVVVWATVVCLLLLALMQWNELRP